MHPPVQLTSTTRRARSKPGALRILAFLPLLLLLLSPPQSVPNSQLAYAIAKATPPPAPPTPPPTHEPMLAPTDEPPVSDMPTPVPPLPSPTTVPPSPSPTTVPPLPSPTATVAYTPTTTLAQPEQPRDQIVLPTMPPVGAWQTPQQLPGIGFDHPIPGNHAVVEPSPSPSAYPASIAATPPAAAHLPSGQTRFIPILMYHYVRYVDQTHDPLGYNLSVTPEQFAGHLNWLAHQGYTTLRMDMVAECLRGLRACPERAIALTFDDGYADAYTTALPLLQHYGFVATFYVVSDFIGQPGYMGWTQLQALRDAGMEIGAHSVSHPNLTALSQNEAYYQIVHSAQHISIGLQTPVVSFCYPAGQFNAEIAALVHNAGYTSATTTMTHWYAGDLYALPRVRMSGGLGQAGFEGLVQAYTP